MLLEPPNDNNDNNSRSDRKPKEVVPNPLVQNLSFERQLQIRVLMDKIGSLTLERPEEKTTDKEVIKYSGYVRLEEAEVIDYQNDVKELLTSLMLQNFELMDAYKKQIGKGLID